MRRFVCQVPRPNTLAASDDTCQVASNHARLTTLKTRTTLQGELQASVFGDRRVESVWGASDQSTRSYSPRHAASFLGVLEDLRMPPLRTRTVLAASMTLASLGSSLDVGACRSQRKSGVRGIHWTRSPLKYCDRAEVRKLVPSRRLGRTGEPSAIDGGKEVRGRTNNIGG
jgi:hypothetical protein